MKKVKQSMGTGEQKQVVREGCLEEVAFELILIIKGNWIKGIWDLSVSFTTACESIIISKS